MHVTDLLLAYTDMELLSHLRKKMIQIEMYAPKWIATLYTRLVDLSLLYELWEIFLFERDKHFIFYFCIGILIAFRDDIMKRNSMEQLIFYLQNIKITSYGLLADIYFHAIQVRRHAPASFELLACQLGLFKYNPIISNEELEVLKTTSKIETMPICSRELMFGSEAVLATLEANNNKFENLLVISENEQ